MKDKGFWSTFKMKISYILTCAIIAVSLRHTLAGITNKNLKLGLVETQVYGSLGV